MGNALVQRQTELTESEFNFIGEQANALAKSGIVPEAYRGKPHDIIAAAMIGREVGLSPMMSMQYLNVIKGKPSMSAEGMVALARRAGHSIVGKDMSDSGVTAVGKRGDDGDTMEFTFTREDAAKAGLSGNNWSGYFRSMAWARAVSQLCRMLFPDVIMGISYTPEELGDTTQHGDTTNEPVAAPESVPTDSERSIAGEAPPVDENGAAPTRRRKCATDDRCTACDGYGVMADGDEIRGCHACDGKGKSLVIDVEPEPDPVVDGVGSSTTPHAPDDTAGTDQPDPEDSPADDGGAVTELSEAEAVAVMQSLSPGPKLTLLNAMVDFGYAESEMHALERLREIVKTGEHTVDDAFCVKQAANMEANPKSLDGDA